MSFWEVGQVGLPCAVIGGLYFCLLGHRFLPNRTELVEQLDERRREYLVEMMVQPECRLVGKTVEQAGLRHLRGLFLVEINREGEVLAPVTPIGYQTDLMVMGPGGYQPRDYLRAGWPLSLLMGATVIAMIPFWWPFALPAGP
jgi:di/tricarboxylate transporter